MHLRCYVNHIVGVLHWQLTRFYAALAYAGYVRADLLLDPQLPEANCYAANATVCRSVFLFTF